MSPQEAIWHFVVIVAAIMVADMLLSAMHNGRRQIV